MIFKDPPQPDEHLPAIPSAPYQKLAEIYDQVMRHVDYRSWAGYIRELLRKYHQASPHILDVGCGTGELMKELTRLGLQVDGCDPSQEMLTIARAKNPDKNLYQDEMPRLIHTPTGYYPVITCLYDTMNYLPSLTSVHDSLMRIYQILPTSGLFIFDMVSETFCLQYFDEVDEEEVINKEYAYERRSYYIKERSEQVNEFSIYTPEGIYSEIHVQNIFPYGEIRQLIQENTPFELAGSFEDFTFRTVKPDSNRVHFILRKRK